MFRTLLISMFLTSTALADTWTVDDDGKADFDNIQAAVDAASNGDEIIVMPGTYTGFGDEVVNMLGKSITLRSSSPLNPDIVEATIISGGGERRGIACVNNETGSTIINGLTITNCYDFFGAGIFLDDNSSPTIQNCVIADNTAFHPLGGARGGGLYCSTGTPSIISCVFSNNHALEGMFKDSYGGAIFSNSVGKWTLMTVTDCTFCSNSPQHIFGNWDDGGGNTIMEECVFDCNENGVSDSVDISSGTSIDCDSNGVPDECQFDCNGNEIPDGCDIASGLAFDCNGNGLPDSCDIVESTSIDCNGNGIPDECDVAEFNSIDCNANGIPDECDIADAPSIDCNVNNIIDSCEVLPLFNAEYKLTPMQDIPAYGIQQFGCSVSISGDIAVVGAPDTQMTNTGGDIIRPGSAHVIRFDGKVWSAEPPIFSSDSFHEDYFGYSVAISGDTVVVGAPYDNDNGSNSGSAYVYRFDGNNWIETKLLASDGVSNDYFGYSVSISGNRAVIGAPYSNKYNGSAYVYRFDGSDWIETKILASDGEFLDGFGLSVCVSGNTVVVGVPEDDDFGVYTGSVYVFEFDGNNWVETKLVASDAAEGAGFGYSIAISGSTIVVGAPVGYSGKSAEKVYIYHNEANTWSETILSASGVEMDRGYGASVAISGDSLVVGAPKDDINGGESGSAYIYKYRNEVWEEVTKIISSDGTYLDWFGNAVAISNGTVIVGAPKDENIIQDGGSVSFIFGKGNNDDTDCNANNIPDDCDIKEATSEDLDMDGVPDECQCPADINLDGLINVSDLLAVIDAWGLTNSPADINDDGIVDVSDLLIVVGNWGPCE